MYNDGWLVVAKPQLALVIPRYISHSIFFEYRTLKDTKAHVEIQLMFLTLSLKMLDFQTTQTTGDIMSRW